MPTCTKPDGIYVFTNGFNRFALLSLLLGILPNVPGFLATIGLLSRDSLPAWIMGLYNYAWFVGFVVAGGSYGLLMRAARLRIPVNNYKEEVNYVSAD